MRCAFIKLTFEIELNVAFIVIKANHSLSRAQPLATLPGQADFIVLERSLLLLAETMRKEGQMIWRCPVDAMAPTSRANCVKLGQNQKNTGDTFEDVF